LHTQKLMASNDELIDAITVRMQQDLPLVRVTCLYYKKNALQCGDKFYVLDISPIVIKNAIRSVSSIALGDDHITIKMLQPITDVLLPLFMHLFNYALQYSCFPHKWKHALVKPVPKVPKPTSASDYTPISIISVIGKILQKSSL
jgi:hypothetical protein